MFLLSHISAQTNSYTISMGPNYANQIFFSMQNGEIANVNNEDWDIAFSTDAFSSTIRINDGKGVELYTYHLGDTSSWININNSITNNLTNPMYNSDSDWSIGAFDVNTTTGLDYGWGVYSMVSHNIIGDSLFIIKTINGNYKKLWMESKSSGDYFFKYANIDGSNLVNQTVSASNYGSKNLIYFSLDQNTIIDREPDSNLWDITFTKYITDYPSPQGGMVPYPVTGVLSNNNIEIAKATGIANPMSYTDYSLHAFETDINSIGYDWKSYQGTYVIDVNRCYFVRDLSQNIWRIIFSGFDGMSTGNIEFNTTLVSNTSSKNIKGVNTFEVFPNPTNGNTNLIYDVESKENIVEIYNMTGEKIYTHSLLSNGLQTLELPTNYISKGIYFVIITDNKNTLSRKKLIIQ